MSHIVFYSILFFSSTIQLKWSNDRPIPTLTGDVQCLPRASLRPYLNHCLQDIYVGPQEDRYLSSFAPTSDEVPKKSDFIEEHRSNMRRIGATLDKRRKEISLQWQREQAREQAREQTREQANRRARSARRVSSQLTQQESQSQSSYATSVTGRRK